MSPCRSADGAGGSSCAGRLYTRMDPAEASNSREAKPVIRYPFSSRSPRGFQLRDGRSTAEASGQTGTLCRGAGRRKPLQRHLMALQPSRGAFVQMLFPGCRLCRVCRSSPVPASAGTGRPCPLVLRGPFTETGKPCPWGRLLCVRSGCLPRRGERREFSSMDATDFSQMCRSGLLPAAGANLSVCAPSQGLQLCSLRRFVSRSPPAGSGCGYFR